jgi:hypothetical protein
VCDQTKPLLKTIEERLSKKSNSTNISQKFSQVGPRFLKKDTQRTAFLFNKSLLETVGKISTNNSFSLQSQCHIFDGVPHDKLENENDRPIQEGALSELHKKVSNFSMP